MPKIMSLLLACLTVASVCHTASASATTLRFAYFWPANSQISTQIAQAWADTVEKESNGELNIQMFPSETLAKADHTYQATANGIADITIAAQGYVAGRFPLTQIVELPGMANSAVQGSCIAQSLFEQQADVAKEYRDSHVLFLFTTGPGFINTRDTLVEKPEDLAGLRIRRPTTVVGEILSSLGAQPVGMPAPDMYTSLQRGVIDGVTLPWEGMKTFHLNELAKNHTVMPLYNLTFVATMNDKTYKRLPENLRKVIDNNSGMEWATKAGQVFDSIDQQGRVDAEKNNQTIVEISNPLEDPAWGPQLRKATDKYLGDLQEKRLPAQTVYKQAQESSVQCASL